MFCQVETEQVMAVHDVQSTYHVPLLLERQGIISLLRSILRLDAVTRSSALVAKGQRIWHEWKTLTTAQDRLFETVSIALVGKYTNLRDSYLSVIKSLEHAAMRCNKKLNLVWVDATHLETSTSRERPADFHKAWHDVCTANGILVPGGFGKRGTEGMMAAARWARLNQVPFLGICLGMQLAVIEFARNVCDLPQASSVELEQEGSVVEPVIIFMPEIDKSRLGGTMRLGLRPTIFQAGSEWSKIRRLYGRRNQGRTDPASPQHHHHLHHDDQGKEVKEGEETSQILERHRHRYEVNPVYIDRLASYGLNFVGKDDRGERMEILEIRGHPWYVGVQFHPEYLSRVLDPSPPYLGLVAASANCLQEFLDGSLIADGAIAGTTPVGADAAAAATAVDGISHGVLGIHLGHHFLSSIDHDDRGKAVIIEKNQQ